MPRLLTPTTWTQQPQQFTTVADNVAFALLPDGNNFVECVSGRLSTTTAGGTNGVHAIGYSGKALYGADTNFYPQTIVKPDAAFGTGDFAVGIVGSFVGVAAAVVAMSNDAAQAAGGNQWRLQPNSNGASTSSGAFCFMTYGGATVAAGANSLFTAGTDYSFLGVRRGTTVELWRNGILVASNTGTVQNVSGSEVQSIGFGWGSGTSNNAGGNRYLGYGIRGTVTPIQAAKLSANPWQIFSKRPPKRFISSVATNLNYTITPSGSITFSDTSAQVHTKVYNPTGTINLNGSAGLTFVSGAVTYTITPAGGIAYSGVSATSHDRVLYPTGSLAFSSTSKLLSTHVLNTSGNVSFSGANTFINSKVFTSSGTITFTGTADLYMPGATVESTKLLLTGVGS